MKTITLSNCNFRIDLYKCLRFIEEEKKVYIWFINDDVPLIITGVCREDLEEVGLM